MGRASIIVPAISQWVAEGRDLARAVVDAEQSCIDIEKKLTTTREAARGRRIELGRFLAGVKDKVKHGEWGEFLEAIEVSRTSAFRHMQEAGVTLSDGEVEQMATQTTGTTGPSFVPPPLDSDAPREADDGATPVVEEPEIDRDTWCTPKWLTDALGRVNLDPCANERSHVDAAKAFRLDKGQDGLQLASSVSKNTVAFLNPPYSSVPPWVQAYGHTRFIFLLKFDPSTKWFAELISRTRLVLFPKGTRIQFEAPEGVPPEKSQANQFPHALFFAHAEDATEELLELCWQWPLETNDLAA